MFAHGFVRIAGRYTQFHDATLSEISQSILPNSLISITAWAIPPLEMIFGLQVFLGFKFKIGLLGNAAVLFILIFGACMVENWRAVNVILLHSLICCILIAFSAYSAVSIEKNK